MDFDIDLRRKLKYLLPSNRMSGDASPEVVSCRWLQQNGVTDFIKRVGTTILETVLSGWKKMKQYFHSIKKCIRKSSVQINCAELNKNERNKPIRKPDRLIRESLWHVSDNSSFVWASVKNKHSKPGVKSPSGVFESCISVNGVDHQKATQLSASTRAETESRESVTPRGTEHPTLAPRRKKKLSKVSETQPSNVVVSEKKDDQMPMKTRSTWTLCNGQNKRDESLKKRNKLSKSNLLPEITEECAEKIYFSVKPEIKQIASEDCLQEQKYRPYPDMKKMTHEERTIKVYHPHKSIVLPIVRKNDRDPEADAGSTDATIMEATVLFPAHVVDHKYWVHTGNLKTIKDNICSKGVRNSEKRFLKEKPLADIGYVTQSEQTIDMKKVLLFRKLKNMKRLYKENNTDCLRYQEARFRLLKYFNTDVTKTCTRMIHKVTFKETMKPGGSDDMDDSAPHSYEQVRMIESLVSLQEQQCCQNTHISEIDSVSDPVVGKKKSNKRDERRSKALAQYTAIKEKYVMGSTVNTNTLEPCNSAKSKFNKIAIKKPSFNLSSGIKSTISHEWSDANKQMEPFDEDKTKIMMSGLIKQEIPTLLRFSSFLKAKECIQEKVKHVDIENKAMIKREHEIFQSVGAIVNEPAKTSSVCTVSEKQTNHVSVIPSGKNTGHTENASVNCHFGKHLPLLKMLLRCSERMEMLPEVKDSRRPVSCVEKKSTVKKVARCHSTDDSDQSTKQRKNITAARRTWASKLKAKHWKHDALKNMKRDLDKKVKSSKKPLSLTNKMALAKGDCLKPSDKPENDGKKMDDIKSQNLLSSIKMNGTISPDVISLRLAVDSLTLKNLPHVLENLVSCNETGMHIADVRLKTAPQATQAIKDASTCTSVHLSFDRIEDLIEYNPNFPLVDVQMELKQNTIVPVSLHPLENTLDLGNSDKSLALEFRPIQDSHHETDLLKKTDYEHVPAKDSCSPRGNSPVKVNKKNATQRTKESSSLGHPWEKREKSLSFEGNHTPPKAEKIEIPETLEKDEHKSYTKDKKFLSNFELNTTLSLVITSLQKCTCKSETAPECTQGQVYNLQPSVGDGGTTDRKENIRQMLLQSSKHLPNLPIYLLTKVKKYVRSCVSDTMLSAKRTLSRKLYLSQYLSKQFRGQMKEGDVNSAQLDEPMLNISRAISFQQEKSEHSMTTREPLKYPVDNKEFERQKRSTQTNAVETSLRKEKNSEEPTDKSYPLQNTMLTSSLKSILNIHKTLYTLKQTRSKVHSVYPTNPSRASPGTQKMNKCLTTSQSKDVLTQAVPSSTLSKKPSSGNMKIHSQENSRKKLNEKKSREVQGKKKTAQTLDKDRKCSSMASGEDYKSTVHITQGTTLEGLKRDEQSVKKPSLPPLTPLNDTKDEKVTTTSSADVAKKFLPPATKGKEMNSQIPEEQHFPVHTVRKKVDVTSASRPGGKNILLQGNNEYKSYTKKHLSFDSTSKNVWKGTPAFRKKLSILLKNNKFVSEKNQQPRNVNTIVKCSASLVSSKNGTVVTGRMDETLAGKSVKKTLTQPMKCSAYLSDSLQSKICSIVESTGKSNITFENSSFSLPGKNVQAEATAVRCKSQSFNMGSSSAKNFNVTRKMSLPVRKLKECKASSGDSLKTLKNNTFNHLKNRKLGFFKKKSLSLSSFKSISSVQLHISSDLEKMPLKYEQTIDKEEEGNEYSESQLSNLPLRMLLNKFQNMSSLQRLKIKDGSNAWIDEEKSQHIATNAELMKFRAPSETGMAKNRWLTDKNCFTKNISKMKDSSIFDNTNSTYQLTPNLDSSNDTQEKSFLSFLSEHTKSAEHESLTGIIVPNKNMCVPLVTMNHFASSEEQISAFDVLSDFQKPHLMSVHSVLGISQENSDESDFSLNTTPGESFEKKKKNSRNVCIFVSFDSVGTCQRSSGKDQKIMSADVNLTENKVFSHNKAISSASAKIIKQKVLESQSESTIPKEEAAKDIVKSNVVNSSTSPRCLVGLSMCTDELPNATSVQKQSPNKDDTTLMAMCTSSDQKNESFLDNTLADVTYFPSSSKVIGTKLRKRKRAPATLSPILGHKKRRLTQTQARDKAAKANHMKRHKRMSVMRQVRHQIRVLLQLNKTSGPNTERRTSDSKCNLGSSPSVMRSFSEHTNISTFRSAEKLEDSSTSKLKNDSLDFFSIRSPLQTAIHENNENVSPVPHIIRSLAKLPPDTEKQDLETLLNLELKKIYVNQESSYNPDTKHLFGKMKKCLRKLDRARWKSGLKVSSASSVFKFSRENSGISPQHSHNFHDLPQQESKVKTHKTLDDFLQGKRCLDSGFKFNSLGRNLKPNGSTVSVTSYSSEEEERLVAILEQPNKSECSRPKNRAAETMSSNGLPSELRCSSFSAKSVKQIKKKRNDLVETPPNERESNLLCALVSTTDGDLFDLASDQCVQRVFPQKALMSFQNSLASDALMASQDRKKTGVCPKSVNCLFTKPTNFTDVETLATHEPPKATVSNAGLKPLESPKPSSITVPVAIIEPTARPLLLEDTPMSAMIFQPSTVPVSDITAFNTAPYTINSTSSFSLSEAADVPDPFTGLLSVAIHEPVSLLESTSMPVHLELSPFPEEESPGSSATNFSKNVHIADMFLTQSSIDRIQAEHDASVFTENVLALSDQCRGNPSTSSSSIVLSWIGSDNSEAENLLAGFEQSTADANQTTNSAQMAISSGYVSNIVDTDKYYCLLNASERGTRIDPIRTFNNSCFDAGTPTEPNCSRNTCNLFNFLTKHDTNINKSRQKQTSLVEEENDRKTNKRSKYSKQPASKSCSSLNVTVMSDLENEYDISPQSISLSISTDSVKKSKAVSTRGRILENLNEVTLVPGSMAAPSSETTIWSKKRAGFKRNVLPERSNVLKEKIINERRPASKHRKTKMTKVNDIQVAVKHRLVKSSARSFPPDSGGSVQDATVYLPSLECQVTTSVLPKATHVVYTANLNDKGNPSRCCQLAQEKTGNDLLQPPCTPLLVSLASGHIYPSHSSTEISNDCAASREECLYGSHKTFCLESSSRTQPVVAPPFVKNSVDPAEVPPTFMTSNIQDMTVRVKKIIQMFEEKKHP